MRCDVCNQEFANSEEVMRHKERGASMGDGKEPGLMENLGMSKRHGAERNRYI